MGHIQRGGNPSIYDRLMAYKFITHAINSLLDGKEESIICYTKTGFNFKSIREVTSTTKTLDKELLNFLN